VRIAVEFTIPTATMRFYSSVSAAGCFAAKAIGSPAAVIAMATVR
jgi:hypothetical protein